MAQYSVAIIPEELPWTSTRQGTSPFQLEVLIGSHSGNMSGLMGHEFFSCGFEEDDDGRREEKEKEKRKEKEKMEKRGGRRGRREGRCNEGSEERRPAGEFFFGKYRKTGDPASVGVGLNFAIFFAKFRPFFEGKKIREI